MKGTQRQRAAAHMVAASGTSGSSGLASVSSEEMESSTAEHTREILRVFAQCTVGRMGTEQGGEDKIKTK
jgi:hypothetical protein